MLVYACQSLLFAFFAAQVTYQVLATVWWVAGRDQKKSMISAIAACIWMFLTFCAKQAGAFSLL